MSTFHSPNKIEFIIGLVLFIICALMFQNSFSVENEGFKIFMVVLGFFGSACGLILMLNWIYNMFVRSN